MILALVTLALIAALTTGSHPVILFLLAGLVAYCIALAAVLAYERRQGEIDIDLDELRGLGGGHPPHAPSRP